MFSTFQILQSCLSMYLLFRKYLISQNFDGKKNYLVRRAQHPSPSPKQGTLLGEAWGGQTGGIFFLFILFLFTFICYRRVTYTYWSYLESIGSIISHHIPLGSCVISVLYAKIQKFQSPAFTLVNVYVGFSSTFKCFEPCFSIL